MFFSLCDQPLLNFTDHWKVGSLWLNTDPGWQRTQLGGWDIVYKGYAESAPLQQLLSQLVCQDHHSEIGNFCVIAWQQNQIKFVTDRWRGFPVWYTQKQCVTNLYPCENTAWCDSLVTLDHSISVVENKHDVIGDIDDTKLCSDQALDLLHQRLRSRIQQFLQHNNHHDLRVFVSGGVDTLLIWSYLQALGADFQVVDYLHTDLDHFYRANSHHLSRFWAYQQIHHWREPVCLASGAPGDEFMLRSPDTGDLWLRSQGTCIPDQLIMQPNGLHQQHFQKPKNQKIFDQNASQSNNITVRSLCNIVINDWQHWHLGNTLTWTPLRDLELFKICCRLDLESGVKQILNSDISRRLIERNVPGATKMLSDQKNSGAVMANLRYQQLQAKNL